MKKDYNIQKGKKLIIKGKGEFHQIAIDSILTITCENYVLIIETLNNHRIHCCKPLSFFEIELDEDGFCRVNRNTIINLNNIVSYSNNTKPVVVMINKETIDISRRRLSEFLNKINK